MIYDQDVARQTAQHLLQIKAIKLSPKNPFTWASGWKSPIYCDNRVSLSYPEVRTYLCQQMAQQIAALYGNNIQIAGVATGAIGIGMLVAQQLGVPFVYVRPEPKKHGRQNQIEGHLHPDKKTVVVEDLISTGKSSLNAVAALRKADAQVMGMIALFTYGFSQASEAFEAHQLALNTLSDYTTLIAAAEANKSIDATASAHLTTWRNDPAAWEAGS